MVMANGRGNGPGVQSKSFDEAIRNITSFPMTLNHGNTNKVTFWVWGLITVFNRYGFLQVLGNDLAFNNADDVCIFMICDGAESCALTFGARTELRATGGITFRAAKAA